MSCFVLVHGAWHGAWCWECVVRRLEERGHTAHVPALAGVGERASELDPPIGVQDHVRDVVNVLDDADEPVVLVGHSYSGLVVRDAAVQRPANVQEVVLVEGWIGPPGRSLFDLAPVWFAQGIRQAADEHGDGWRIPAPDPAVVGVTDPADAARLRERLTAHPFKTFTDPTTSGYDAPLSMRAVVASPGPVPFAEMGAKLGISTQQIEGGHDLMITSPQALADALMGGP